jgi:hypothetical protein
MANTLSKENISTGQAVTAAQITQSIDAFTGESSYDITLSGSLEVTGSILLSGSLMITGSDVEIDGDLVINRGSSGKHVIIGNTDEEPSNLPVNIDLYVKGGISSSAIIFGSQLTTKGRVNTPIIQSSTDVVTINDNLNVVGNITASGYINALRNFKSIDNAEVSGVIAMSGSVNGYGSGTIIGLDLSTSGTNLEFKLPSLPPQYIGYEYDFVVNNTAGSGTVFKISAVITEGLNGIAICDDGTEDIQGTTFTFAATKAIKGTRLKCIADGVGWHMTAFCLCDLADVSTG